LVLEEPKISIGNLALEVISEFDVNEFTRLVENKLHKNRDTDVSIRAIKLVDSIVEALDIVVPIRKFRIPKVWEGKKWFLDEIREAADRRDKAYKKAIYENTEQN